VTLDPIPPRYRPTRAGIRALLQDGCAWSSRELAEVGGWNQRLVARVLSNMYLCGHVRRVGWTGWRIAQSLEANRV
jgi:hypothetical protein